MLHRTMLQRTMFRRTVFQRTILILAMALPISFAAIAADKQDEVPPADDAKKEAQEITLVETRTSRHADDIAPATITVGKVQVRLRKNGHRNFTVQLFEAGTDHPLGPIRKFFDHAVTALAIGPDETTIAVGTADYAEDWGNLAVFDGRSGEPVRLKPPASGGEIFGIRFSEDGKTLFVAARRPPKS